MSAWSHLPNAKHIDRVITSVNSQPELWNQAWVQVSEQALGPASRQAMDQVWASAHRGAHHHALMESWRQVQDQARSQVCNPVCDQVTINARGNILALVAYDDCAKYLNLPIDQLKMLYQLNEHPACLLLQPAVLVFAKEKELVLG